MGLYDIKMLNDGNLASAANILNSANKSISDGTNNLYQALAGARKEMIFDPKMAQENRNNALLENQINSTTDRNQLQ